MSEAGYVELPVIKWLSGHPDPADTVLGWSYRVEAAMTVYDRPLDDPLVEKILIEKFKLINPDVKTDTQAQMAVAALRKAMAHPDKLTANR